MESETWAFASNLIASHAVLAPSSPGSVTEVISYGQIPLTSALLASSSASDLKPECVTPLLRDHLHWRIQTFDNQAIDVERVPSLKLYVAGQKVHQWGWGTSDRLPVYEPLIAYRSVTKGKAGGLRDEDPL